MPITENNFTADELRTALDANPDLVKTLGGFVLDEANKDHPLRKHLEPGFVSPVTSRHATEIEKQVEALTGIKKPEANMKYYDYLNHAVSEVIKARDAKETELAGLRGKANLTEAEKARIQTLEKAIADKNDELKTKLQEKDQEIVSLKGLAKLDVELAKLRSRYKKDLPQSLVDLAEEQAKKALIAKMKIQDDGALTFVDDKGEVILNKQTYKAEGADAFLSEYLKDIIDPGVKVEGAGSKEGSQKQDTNTSVTKGAFVWNGIPPGVSTRSAVSEHLKKNGILDGSPEFDKVFEEEAVKALPLR